MDPATAMVVGGTAVNVIGGIIGGRKAASAAADQAEQQAIATQARHQYDLDMWDMKRSQLQAQRSEAVDRIMAQARNEGKIRLYKDAQAQQQYDYALKIRNAKQTSNEIAYQRSDDIFSDQVTLNNMSAKAAMNDEIVKLQESQAESRFNANDSYIDMLLNEGKLRARSASGRSARKGYQATMADYGRQIEMLNASDNSQDRNSRAVLMEIIRDKSSADLTAFASKMLDPGVLPDPIKAEPIPEAEFSLPRVLQEYDFGPQPIRGFMASPGAAADAVWGQTISGVAGAIGSGMSSLGSMEGFGEGWGGDDGFNPNPQPNNWKMNSSNPAYTEIGS